MHSIPREQPVCVYTYKGRRIPAQPCRYRRFALEGCPGEYKAAVLDEEQCLKAMGGSDPAPLFSVYNQEDIISNSLHIHPAICMNARIWLDQIPETPEMESRFIKIRKLSRNFLKTSFHCFSISLYWGQKVEAELPF